MRPTCRRHSKLCIIEPVATGLRAVANTMQRRKSINVVAGEFAAAIVFGLLLAGVKIQVFARLKMS
ncbi:MAG: hypothetical protein P4L44_06565 [Oryzomonas sp.]|nr:hypothetical protein [Oryzomonas sp.]MDR3579605.1 hypothetical protein [Oryzomonas sp.]